MPTEEDRLREQCRLYDKYISMLYNHINSLVGYVDSLHFEDSEQEAHRERILHMFSIQWGQLRQEHFDGKTEVPDVHIPRGGYREG